MKERSILFSGPMVRALLDGRKTQTRRVMKPGKGQGWLSAATFERVRRFEYQQDGWWGMAVGPPRRIVHCGHDMDGGHIGSVLCPFGIPGDRLWVRETWWHHKDTYLEQAGWPGCTVANLDGTGSRPHLNPEFDPSQHSIWRKRPSIHMPRWASRITLELIAVRVERLQDISEADAIAEGISGPHNVGYPAFRVPGDSKPRFSSAIAAFESLWDSLNAKRAPWASNPWVWVLEFTRVTP